jgi:hypothetical protein
MFPYLPCKPSPQVAPQVTVQRHLCGLRVQLLGRCLLLHRMDGGDALAAEHAAPGAFPVCCMWRDASVARLAVVHPRLCSFSMLRPRWGVVRALQ